MSDNKNLPPSTAPAPQTDLHGAIMNLSARVPESCKAHDSMLAYKIGHRDARHAAAEMAIGYERASPARVPLTAPQILETYHYQMSIDGGDVEKSVINTVRVLQAAQAAPSAPTDSEIDALWREATAGNHGDTTQAFVRWFARELIASKAAPSVKVEPVAWAGFAENGNIRIWTCAPENVEELGKCVGMNLKPLYLTAPAVQAEDVRNQAQWISVDDERKPEERKPVLLFVRTLTRGEDDEGRPYETEGEQVEMGEYRLNNGSPYFQCFVSPMSDNDWVTHWMPLPAAPGTSQTSEQQGGGND